MTTNRLRPWALSLAVCATLLVACGTAGGSSNPEDDSVIIEPIAGVTEAIPGSPVAPSPEVPSTPTAAQLSGFIFPIVGGCLPQGDQLMPNAPRTYRNGIHEGVDFYAVDNCTAIGLGTPVVAAKAGRVIRADLNYQDVTAADIQRLSANPNTDEALDSFRGRQVWVDHGGGIVTRYAHLSGIAPGLQVGSEVTQGQTIAFVGESGTPESVSSPGHEYHLHFELRIGPGFLGKDLPPAEVRGLYRTLFAP